MIEANPGSIPVPRLSSAHPETGESRLGSRIREPRDRACGACHDSWLSIGEPAEPSQTVWSAREPALVSNVHPFGRATMDRWRSLARLRQGDGFRLGPVALVVAAVTSLLADVWL
jgi:hypothetical protein